MKVGDLVKWSIDPSYWGIILEKSLAMDVYESHQLHSMEMSPHEQVYKIWWYPFAKNIGVFTTTDLILFSEGENEKTFDY
tara:strand:- start:134 stop:373 length:240 start_codon:yes stop_codon:yes gene_type:complete